MFGKGLFAVYAVVIALLVVAVGASVDYISDQQAVKVPAAAQRCEEDMPCWNCATMGNRRCGVIGVDDVAISQDRRGNVTLVQGLRRGKPVVTYFDASLND